jgi:DNA-binding XRE family transcriptional regulator
MYNPILVNPQVVRPLIARVRSAFLYSQTQLGEAIGVSKRTVLRWEGGGSSPSDFQVAAMARLVYPRDREIARELAAALGKSLVDLDIEAPAPPPPPPLPAPVGPKRPSPAYLADSVVCVAAETASILPQAMRAPLLAAAERMVALELSAADLVEALRPTSKTKREK